MTRREAMRQTEQENRLMSLGISRQHCEQLRRMMTKEELHALAAPGVAQKVAAIEAELATYHKEWPELFLSPTPPQLLKAHQRRNGNGHWPIVATPATDAATTRKAEVSQTLKAGWTPARRALMARLMRKRSKQMHAARRAAARKKKQPVDVS